ncbi:MBL fold metallo-hydrolase [Butyrivibrio sp. AD3002]|uniref:MBL fold metallo-hydrolase n=1 Tax=Butyrivibrio sp. AD3002 TaxID=1280670 RepID=UPI00040C562E|nr:MBL fold metallo-hydrolase [Butyrivibrio sp. AD3002]
MAVKFMRTGQQGILVWDEETGYRFGIDLFLSDMEGRQVKTPFDIEALKDVSLFFGTHDHIDHIDRDAWVKIAGINSKAKFVAPKYFEKTLPDELGIEKERFIFVDEEYSADVDDLHIEAIPAAHEFLDTSPEGLHPYLMYIVTFSGKKICHMGDTCLYEGVYDKLRKSGPFDVMFPPINGRDAVRLRDNCIGNMTYQEAADLVGTLKPALAVPGHYDMFKFNGADPNEFKDYVEIKYPGQKVMIMQPGEEFEL